MIQHFKRIVFFNGHQHGDVANTRGIVNYIVNKLGDSFEYFFVHQKHQDAVQFNQRVQVIRQEPSVELPFPILGDVKSSHEQRLHYVIDDTIYLNLWIGCSPYYLEFRSTRGHGITRKSLQHQAIECIDYIKQVSNIDIEYPSESDTLPITTDVGRNEQLISEFVSRIQPNYRKRVFISNGDVESGQTPQFNFGDQLKQLMVDNQDVVFIYTAKNFNFQSDNVIFIDDCFSFPNLKDMDIVSKYCDVLITRASGPGCVVSTVDNYYDTTKTFISFTTNPCIAFEALCSDEEIENKKWGYDNTAKMIWSNDFSSENLCRVIGEAIR